MHRSITLIMTLFAVYALSAFSQTPAITDPQTNSQTLRAILAELRQLRHDLQGTSAMAARAQIALYRLQQEDVAVARAEQRVSDVHARVIQLEDARQHKAKDIEQDQTAANRSDTSAKAQQDFEQVMLPWLKSELELVQTQEQQAQAEQAAAEQQLHDEQRKLEELNDLLNRYNTALEQVSAK